MIDIILGALCEYRAPGHYQAHGGLAEDSAWHVANGDLPTCNPKDRYVSSSDESDEGDDNGPSWRRDSFGFSCGILGCG